MFYISHICKAAKKVTQINQTTQHLSVSVLGDIMAEHAKKKTTTAAALTEPKLGYGVCGTPGSEKLSLSIGHNLRQTKTSKILCLNGGKRRYLYTYIYECKEVMNYFLFLFNVGVKGISYFLLLLYRVL